MLDVLVALLGVALGVAAGVLSARRSRSRLEQERAALAARLEMLEPLPARLESLAAEKAEREQQVARLEQQLRSGEERVAWMDRAQDKLREAFQALSSQALRSNADEYLKRVREQLDGMQSLMKGDWGRQKEEMSGLVGPLRENLTRLDQQVQAMESKREGAYEGLRTSLQQLQGAYVSLRDTTTSLSTALTTSPGSRGSWGEISLRRIVELAGMTSRVDFMEQAQQDQGRPDMVIALPNGGRLPVDSKTTLATYRQVAEAQDAEARRTALENHAGNVRLRVAELARKEYWAQFASAPEFVVMFLPHDGFLAAALEGDRKGGLLEYAFERRVLLVTPITLLALLKTVAYGWQQQEVAANAREIARQGKELYARLSTFADHIRKTGKALDGAVRSYNDAVGSMEARLLPAVRRLEQLGVSSSELEAPAPVDRQARLPSPGGVNGEPQAQESVAGPDG